MLEGKNMQKFSLLFLSLASLISAETINIKLPKVPEVPKVMAEVPVVKVTTSGHQKTNEEILKEFTQKKEVHFSNHVAPSYAEKQDDPNKVVLVGDVKNGRVPAYLHAPLLSASDLKRALENAGFTVLKTFKVDRKGIAQSVVFTNDDLIKLASKKGRGFISTLRATIDKKDNFVSISNPIYVMSAFLQDSYDAKIAEKTLQSLRGAFKELQNSNEELKLSALSHFQFMAGMPKYQDMEIIAKSTSQKLLANAKKSKKVVYEQKLLNGSTIVGVKLGKRTTKFIKKIGYKNAGLLPYPVLIENGEAKILDPKYYIAIMYPMLKMSEFMTIATVPGAINKDIDRIFR